MTSEVIAITLVHSLTGKVLQQISVAPSLSVADFKLQVATDPSQVLLTFAGRPLCPDELLGDTVLSCWDGSEASYRALEIALRRVEPKWLQALEQVSVSRSSFESHHAQHKEEMQDALVNNSEQSATLTSVAAEMNKVYKETLVKVTRSGNELLVAGGDLAKNRDIVFDLVLPRSSKGARQAAEELKFCRESVLASVQANGVVLNSLNAKLVPAKQAVLSSLKESALALQNAQEALRREGEILHLAKARGWLFVETAADLEKEYRSTLQSVCAGSKALETVAKDVQKCRDSYRRAITVNGKAVKSALTSLQKDQEVVFDWAMEHVSEMRRCDRDFAMTVVEANGEALERVPEEFKCDREIVMRAVQQSEGWALQFADPELRRDRNLVLTAVRRNGWVLEFAAPELKEDYEVVMTAVQANGEALEHAAESLKNNRDIVLAAMRKSNGFALQLASKAMQLDREVVLAALAENGLVLEHVAKDLQDDKEVVMTAVQMNGMALQHVSENIKSNREVVLAAINQNPSSLEYASEGLRGDREIVAVCLLKDGMSLGFASDELKNDRNLVLSAIYRSGSSVLQYVSKELTADTAILNESMQCRSRELTAQHAEREMTWCPGPDTLEMPTSSIVTL